MTRSNRAPNSSSQITGCTRVMATNQGWRHRMRSQRPLISSEWVSSGGHGVSSFVSSSDANDRPTRCR